ncbi:MAG: helix-turn-helix transcriptional regulator [Magnetococcales bacterium]|nr:helix-turn-helix transcriptional regulator [Magnetococcales bacterium]
MTTSGTIPRFFQKRNNLDNMPKQFNLIDLGDISCVKYYHHDDHSKHYVHVTTYLFVVVLNGTKIMHAKSGDIIIREGDAFFAQKNSYIYSEFLSNDSPFESIIFFISDKFFSDFLKSNFHLVKMKSSSLATPSIFPVPVTPLFRSSIDSIIPLFIHESEHKKELLRLKFCEILLHLVESDTNGNFINFLNTIYSNRKKNLENLMETNFTKPLNIDEFARLSGRSLSSFKKEFSQQFNSSPKRWVNYKRLEKAYFLLSQNEKNVTEICFEVGFENISYFSQLFKQHFGVTPNQVKKSQNQQNLTQN